MEGKVGGRGGEEKFAFWLAYGILVNVQWHDRALLSLQLPVLFHINFKYNAYAPLHLITLCLEYDVGLALSLSLSLDTQLN